MSELTRRDYFAAMAMQSLIIIGATKIETCKKKDGTEYDFPDAPFYFGDEISGLGLASDARVIADELIKELDNTLIYR